MKDRAIQYIDHSDEGELLDVKINPQHDAEGKIISGFVIGSTLEQNKALILIAQPGDFKANPTLGVGFEDILLSGDLLKYRHKIREQFKKDGLKVTQLKLYNLDNIKIEAAYE